MPLHVARHENGEDVEEMRFYQQKTTHEWHDCTCVLAHSLYIHFLYAYIIYTCNDETFFYLGKSFKRSKLLLLKVYRNDSL